MLRGNEASIMANDLNFINCEKDIYFIRTDEDLLKAKEDIQSNYGGKVEVCNKVVIIYTDVDDIKIIDLVCMGVVNVICVEPEEINNLSITTATLNDISKVKTAEFLSNLEYAPLNKKQIIGLMIMTLQFAMYPCLKIFTNNANFEKFINCEVDELGESNDSELQLLRDELSKAVENLKILQDEVDDVHKQLSDKIQEYNELDRQAKQVLELINTMNQAPVQDVKSDEYIKENERLQTELEIVNNSLLAVEEEKSSLRIQKDDLQKKVDELSETLNTLQQSQVVSDELQVITNERDQLILEKERLSETIRNMSADMEENAKLLLNANSENSNLQSKLTYINEQFTKLETEFNEYMENSNSDGEHEQEIESKIQELQDKINELTLDLENEKALNRNLSQQIVDKTQDINNLNQILDSEKSSKLEVEQKLHELELKNQDSASTLSEEVENNLINALIVGGVDKKNFEKVTGEQVIELALQFINQQVRNNKNGALPPELVNHYENQLKENQKLLSDFNKQVGKLESTVKNKDLLLRELQVTIENMTKEKSETIEESPTVSVDMAQYTQLKEEHFKLKEDYKEILSKIQNMNVDVSSTVTEEQVNSYIQELEIKQSDIDASQERILELENEITELNKTISENKVEDNSTEIFELNQKILEYVSENSKLVENQKEKELELNNLQEKYAKMLLDYEDIQQKFENLTKSVDNSQEKESDGLFDEIKKQLENSNNQIVDLNNKLDSIKADYNVLSEESLENDKRSKKTISELEAKLKVYESDMEAIIKSKVEAAVALAKSESEELELAVDELEKRVSTATLSAQPKLNQIEKREEVQNIITDANLMNTKSLTVIKELINCRYLEDIAQHLSMGMSMILKNTSIQPITFILDPYANEPFRKAQYENAEIKVNKLDIDVNTATSFIVATDYTTFLELKDFGIHNNAVITIIDRYPNSVVNRKDATQYDLISDNIELPKRRGVGELNVMNLFTQNYSELTFSEKQSILVRAMPFANLLSEIREKVEQ